MHFMRAGGCRSTRQPTNILQLVFEVIDFDNFIDSGSDEPPWPIVLVFFLNKNKFNIGFILLK